MNEDFFHNYLMLPFAAPRLSIALLIIMGWIGAWAGRKRTQFVWGFLKTVFIFHVPLFVFVFSGAVTPDAKDGCKIGWLACFMGTKISLLPLVIWATAALYAHDVLKRENPLAWIRSGIFIGCVTSGLCVLFLLANFLPMLAKIIPDIVHMRWHTITSGGSLAFMIPASVPYYVFAWYLKRTIQLIKRGSLSGREMTTATAVSAPFVVGSLLWAHKIYEALPDTHQGCFVVTAASRGHHRIVGPSRIIRRGGVTRHANSQLLAFWNLENEWQRVSPSTHRAFRRIYKIIGPRIAARIRSPWVADAVHLALKPAEYSAILCAALLRRFQTLEKSGAENSSVWKVSGNE